jgi:hypothetical protein
MSTTVLAVLVTRAIIATQTTTNVVAFHAATTEFALNMLTRTPVNVPLVGSKLMIATPTSTSARPLLVELMAAAATASQATSATAKMGGEETTAPSKFSDV